MSECIFCKILAGELPGEVLNQSDRAVAIRDINPAAPVHALVISKEHVPTISQFHDVDAGLLDDMFALANRVAEDQGISESGYRLVFNNGPDSGMLVPHLHLHVVGGAPLGPIAHAGRGQG